MKKTLWVICFLLLSSGMCVAAEETQYSCGKTMYGELAIAGFQNYPPFSWNVEKIDDFDRKSYEHYGFIYALVIQALKEAGMTYVKPLVFANDDEMRKAGKAGKLDLLYTTYYSDATQSGLDYVFPAYFGNPFVVISRAEKPVDVEDVKQLSGMRGVVRNEEGVKPLIVGLLSSDTKIDWVDGARVAFQKLMSGEADFMIGSPYAAVAEAKRFGIYDKIHLSQKPLRSVKLFAAFPKLSRCRTQKDAFAEKFNALVKDSAEKERLLNEAITQWVEQNKNEPAFTY